MLPKANGSSETQLGRRGGDLPRRDTRNDDGLSSGASPIPAGATWLIRWPVGGSGILPYLALTSPPRRHLCVSCLSLDTLVYKVSSRIDSLHHHHCYSFASLEGVAFRRLPNQRI